MNPFSLEVCLGLVDVGSLGHSHTFLGYYIDSHTVTMAWPIAKRQKLQFFLTTLLQDDDANIRDPLL
jgi:hypothetical protein